MEFTGERYVPNSVEDLELKIEHIHRYHSILEYIKDKIVLDAACGEGYGSDIISKYATKVYSVDISEEAIKNASKSYGKDNISFLCSSISSLPIEDKSIDVVVSFETIEHVTEEIQKCFLAEIKRVLKEDGVLIISTPNKKIYSDLYNYKNEFHIKEFYKDEFYNFLKNYFTNIKIYDQRFEIVSIIDNEECKTLNIIDRVSNTSENEKYFIALCSMKSIESNILGSIINEYDNKYINIIKRIIQTQEEIEKLSSWGINLDKEIEEKNKYIRELQKEVIQSNEESQQLNIKLTNIYKSKSWRWTKIFRYISRKFKKI